MAYRRHNNRDISQNKDLTGFTTQEAASTGTEVADPSLLDLLYSVQGATVPSRLGRKFLEYDKDAAIIDAPIEYVGDGMYRFGYYEPYPDDNIVVFSKSDDGIPFTYNSLLSTLRHEEQHRLSNRRVPNTRNTTFNNIASRAYFNREHDPEITELTNKLLERQYDIRKIPTEILSRIAEIDDFSWEVPDPYAWEDKDTLDLRDFADIARAARVNGVPDSLKLGLVMHNNKNSMSDW